MKKILPLLFAFFCLQLVFSQSSEDNEPHRLGDVEVVPQFPGGYNAFMKFIGKNFVMPQYEGRGGVLKMSFIVEKDGSISTIKVIQGVGEESLGQEAKRVIALSPLWMPGEIESKKVRVIYEVPIHVSSQLE